MYVIEEKTKETKAGFIRWATTFGEWPMTYITHKIEEAKQFDTMVEAYNYIKKNKIKAKDYKVVSTR